MSDLIYSFPIVLAALDAPAIFVVNGLVWYVNLILAITVHEAAHAWAAHLMGDSTAYEGGQVSLDPRPHLRREPFGTIVFPILSYIYYGGVWMMGWASAPYNPHWAMRYPKRAALMAAAGPASNLLLTILALSAMKIGLASGFFIMPEHVKLVSIVGATEGFGVTVSLVVSIMFSLNLILFIFNLIPVPPLDGSAILMLALPRATAERYQEALMQKPGLAIIGLMIAWYGASYVIWPVISFVINRIIYP